MTSARTLVLCGFLGTLGVGCTLELETDDDSLATVAAGLEMVDPGSPPGEEEWFGTAVAMGDFDGDGLDELAIGVPREDVGSVDAPGAVLVDYGARGPRQLVTEDSPGILDYAEYGDYFGQVLATGDFNGDGKDDLVVGVPNEEHAPSKTGAVHVIYGSDEGLTAAGDQFIFPGNDMGGDPASFHGFGTSLAVGDFNGDLVDDLAVGENWWSGAYVYVIPGSQPSGLVPSSAVAIQSPTYGERFGSVLAAGNLNGDAFDDLVASSTEYDAGGVSNSGAIRVFYGSSAFQTKPTVELSQATPGIAGTPEAEDHFGYSLACDDFNADGFDDLAVGVPWEDVGSVANAGSVNIIFGSQNGPITAGNYQLHQDSSGVTGSPLVGGHFGWRLTTGRYNADLAADLAVGAPHAWDGPGSAYVFLGGSSGPSGASDTRFTQDSPGIPGAEGIDDRFGISVASGDFNGDGRSDLAIGAPYEDFSPQLANAGVAHLLFGTSSGITGSGSMLFSE